MPYGVYTPTRRPVTRRGCNSPTACCGKAPESTANRSCRPLDLETGRTEVFARLPQEDFGEGITLLDGKLYQLTWQSNKAYVYDLKTGKKIKEFRYPGEGWGLTTDGQKALHVGRHGQYLHARPCDVQTRETHDGDAQRHGDQFPQRAGVDRRQVVGQRLRPTRSSLSTRRRAWSKGVVDLTGLLPDEEVTPTTDVLNGIAYDAAGRIFVTGKNWSKLFEIEIIGK